MVQKTTYHMKRRRRREARTNYHKRLSAVKSADNRLVARVLNNTVVAQIIKYNPKGDETVINTRSVELKKYGWKGHGSNSPAAYLTGYLCATKAQGKGIKTAFLDIGRHTPVKEANVFAVLKGAIDGGLKINHDAKVMPPEDRVKGRLADSNTGKKSNVDEVIENIKKKVNK